MSIQSSVFLKREAMPTPAQWAAAIRDVGFAFELGEDFDVEELSGFLPCRYDGAEAGFEYFFRSADTSELSDEERRLVGDRTVQIDFVTHSSYLDLMAAVIAGCVLAHLADGVRWDLETGEMSRGAEMLEAARSLEKDLRADLAREKQRST